MSRTWPPHHSLYLEDLSSSFGAAPELRRFLRDHPDLLVVDVGASAAELKAVHPRTLCLNLMWRPFLDLVGDGYQLPLRSETVDMVVLKTILEHVRDPRAIMAEVDRVLKPGGYVYLKNPFLQPFHAAPDDYQRFTIRGTRELMSGYEEVVSGVSVGPGSALAWFLREYLAMLLSGGRQPWHGRWLRVAGWLTFWLKYTGRPGQ